LRAPTTRNAENLESKQGSAIPDRRNYFAAGAGEAVGEGVAAGVAGAALPAVVGAAAGVAAAAACGCAPGLIQQA